MSVGIKHEHPACGHLRCYCYLHDALFCEYCNEWLEEVCGDRKCVHCKDRPEKPKDRKFAKRD